jgi:hypothetical protein
MGKKNKKNTLLQKLSSKFSTLIKNYKGKETDPSILKEVAKLEELFTLIKQTNPQKQSSLPLLESINSALEA